MAKVRWGLISTGSISRTFARGVQKSSTGQLAAVASRTAESAQTFCEKFPECRPFSSYQEMLNADGIDAVYIATPHPQHAEWAIKALRAGKHVLCEKPVGMNHAEAMGIYAAAEEAGLFAMEAFMYRCHPQTDKLVDLVEAGEIGDVCLIETKFGFAAPFNAEHRLFSNELGGGGILDIGCYPVSVARLIAGRAVGKAYDNPVTVSGLANLGQTGVDEHAVGLLNFESGITAQVSAAIAAPLGVGVTVTGTKGRLRVASPWHAAGHEGGTTTVDIMRLPDGGLEGKWEPIEVTDDRPLYAIEADRVGEAILAGRTQSDAMSWDDSMGNMQTLDRWREAVGLRYEAEKPTAFLPTLTKEPLKLRSESSMLYGTLAGIDKNISRLAMGCDNQMTLPHATVMFDAFFENGGTLFDTAHIYENGVMERLLGQWMKNRNSREDVVVLSKGAHTPWCTPDHMRKQLQESLDRLQTDYVDIYLLHRDNEKVPVGEFVDVLNEHAAKGMIKVFGASNWGIERLSEALSYAQKTNQQSFQVLSNNFSLARMVEPIWSGCISASTPEFKNWITENSLTLMAWSSQARGFFTERGDPDNPELERDVGGWVSQDNFERRRRAMKLASEMNVEPVQIALAYVLSQPLGPYALIGPRTLREMRSSLGALSISLSSQQIAWLNLEADQPT